MSFLELVFPKFCLGCHQVGRYFCIRCQERLPYTSYDICIYCHKASYQGYTHPRCRRKFGIDCYISLFHYDSFVKKIIKTIKYRLATEVLNELFEIIQKRLREKIIQLQSLNSNVSLQPIPLYKERLRQRGFNQAFLIAEWLKNYGSFSIGDFLMRTKHTDAQAQLPHGKQRYENVRGAFSIINNPAGSSIILVDDVVTTGATVKEACLVLSRHGAENLTVFTLAKG